MRCIFGTARLIQFGVCAMGLWSAAIALSARTTASLEPAGWDSGLTLVEARDKNPDPKIVEVDLTARVADVAVAPGKVVHAWTYDGGLPGPLIRARVGDRIIVHFKNDLPESTTIHWHGMRIPIEMDGVPEISQPPVQPGEAFTYDFVARDAGLFWYHPHVMSAAQVGFGLYGALLIEDPDDGVGIADQLTLVLSDIGFDEHGVLDSADTGGPAGTVFGREGACILANGKLMPTLRVRSGAPQRWRIVNAAKSRYFLLDLDGQPFYVIGGDGGLQESPQTVRTLLITPGERADVIVRPTRGNADTIPLRARLYDRGYGSIRVPDRRKRPRGGVHRRSNLAAVTTAGRPSSLRSANARGRNEGRHRPDAPVSGSRWEVGVPGERGAVLAGEAVSGDCRRDGRSGS